ncbi:MAG: hypothetical protein M3P14_05715 [Chloroflexota bacterium]|nr:hypothetical protein [Chloroflexota bacterium]
MNLPPVAADEERSIVVDTVHEMHADHRDPQRQEIQQNLWVALLPLALITLLVLAFVAAAWTILAAA